MMRHGQVSIKSFKVFGSDYIAGWLGVALRMSKNLTIDRQVLAQLFHPIVKLNIFHFVDICHQSEGMAQ